MKTEDVPSFGDTIDSEVPQELLGVEGRYISVAKVHQPKGE